MALYVYDCPEHGEYEVLTSVMGHDDGCPVCGEVGERQVTNIADRVYTK